MTTIGTVHEITTIPPALLLQTTWTNKTIWPTQFKQIIPAISIRAKPLQKFLMIFWVIFIRHVASSILMILYQIFTLVKQIGSYLNFRLCILSFELLGDLVPW